MNLHQPGLYCSSHAGDSLIPYTTQLAGPPGHFKSFFYIEGISCVALWIFLKSFKGSQTPKKQHLASACPITLAKWPQDLHYWQPSSVFQVRQSPAKAATTCKSLFIANEVVPGRAKAVNELHLHRSHCQEATEQTHVRPNSGLHQNTTQPHPQTTNLKG